MNKIAQQNYILENYQPDNHTSYKNNLTYPLVFFVTSSGQNKILNEFISCGIITVSPTWPVSFIRVHTGVYEWGSEHNT